MSLRGEIYKLMNHTSIDAEWGTNEILKLIEKRIDEEWNAVVIRDSEFTQGYLQALYDVKDLLK